MAFAHTIGNRRYTFSTLCELLARATPLRSGDELAGLAAASAEERVAAQFALADVPLSAFARTTSCRTKATKSRASSSTPTRRGLRAHPLPSLLASCATGSSLTTPRPSTWLLSHPGSCRRWPRPWQTHARAGSDCCGRANPRRHPLSHHRRTPRPARARLQPNHPTDDPRRHRRLHSRRPVVRLRRRCHRHQSRRRQRGIATQLLRMHRSLRTRFEIPTQCCVLAHITTQMAALERRRAGRSPLSIHRRNRGRQQRLRNQPLPAGGSKRQAARCTAVRLCADGIGYNVMYFETGQGSALSANAHHGFDQQTLEARAYAVARHF